MYSLRNILLLLLSLTCLYTLASGFTLNNNNKLYQIDLIVFTQYSDAAMQAEYWPNILKQPNLQGVIEPDFSQQLGLQQEAKKLQQNSKYQIVLHTSWTQTISTPRQAKWIHIYGGQPYNAQGKPIPNNSNERPTYWQLNGKIKINKLYFFDIYTKLYLTIPEAGNYHPIPLRTFCLIQHRRTRSNQLNYLDHPMFGVLIKITPSE